MDDDVAQQRGGPEDGEKDTFAFPVRRAGKKGTVTNMRVCCGGGSLV